MNKGKPVKNERELSIYRLQNVVAKIFRFCLLFGLCFMILYPFIAKISSMFMSVSDLKDPIVMLIPRKPTFDNIKNVIKYSDFWQALINTFTISILCALLQVASSAVVGYGLAKFKFKCKLLIIILLVLTIITAWKH